MATRSFVRKNRVTLLDQLLTQAAEKSINTKFEGE
jgi:hypothetical protein